MQNPTIGLTFLAGMGYFFSPCTLPLIPSYLVYLSGISIPQMTGRKRLTVFLNAVFFLAGLLFLFVAVGASATLFGNFLRRYLKILQGIGGAVIIVLGIFLIRKPAFLYRFSQGRNPGVKPVGLLGSFLVGLSLSAGWTGCSTPILGAVLMTAAVSETVRLGIYLLCAFSLGLAVPFLISALLIDFLLTPLRRIQRHMRKIEIGLGLLFVTFGLRLLFASFPLHFPFHF
ncbi:MAG: cytochrome c biogenesis protein CcdA [Candidatus Ratteibacteria bacterium]|jgi:cytochrome c-type biogenesis protein